MEPHLFLKMNNPLIFGNDTTENIVSCEVFDDTVELFIEKDGVVTSEFKPNEYWILSAFQYDASWIRMKGNLHYKYIKTFDNVQDFYTTKRALKDADIYSVADHKEAAMLRYGFTYFKGMKVENVSALFFDIETTGIQHNSDSRVLLISNTFVRNGEIVRKLFAYDDYETDVEMFDAWCEWVRKIDPSILCGHNIFGYDLPYLSYCAQQSNTDLYLGRNGSPIRFNKYTSKFRKDGSQDYDYFRAFIYGREIVDTFFLSIHFDFARKYESYGLKAIIKHEGLEREDRQFYDASTIGQNYKDPVEWAKIKEYAMHDADDAYSLYKLMIPAYFYWTQSIPKTFQTINYSATGSQLNSLLVRSYLQEDHSIPKSSASFPFEGAISLGNPGMYKNVFKVDVASLYPSIMIQYKIFDSVKDPLGNFLKMVNYFTEERLKNKQLGKETNNRYYKELEQSQKIGINSAYGLLGSVGLNFNSPVNAELVTRKGREILTQAMDWATNNRFKIVNADTDSISICNFDMSIIDKDGMSDIVKTINQKFPDKIRWEDDGYFLSFVVLKAKNYAYKTTDGKTKYKGSALKSSKLEPALKEFQKEILEILLA